MDFFEMIDTRHSVRKFSEQPIDRQVLEKILQAALTAPSSKNCRSTEFIVVEDRETIARIARMRDFGSAFLDNAPVAVLVVGNTALTDLWVDNCAISATYLQLAAEAVGLGSCWVHVNGRPRSKDNPDEGDAETYLRTFLPVKDAFRVLCVVALGYPSDSERRPRRPYPEWRGKVTFVKKP